MAHYDYDLAIFGGGAAGLTVAAGAAQLGAKTLLVEKESALGGDCLHHGCVPSKTLIKSARVRHMMARAETFGLPSTDLPPVDFARVAQRIRSVIQTIQRHDSVERFCSLGAQVEFGEPMFVDEHAFVLDGKTLSAEKIVIATGSSPAVPPIPGLQDVDYLTNKEVFSRDKLPESLVVLGAGPIAVEMAQAFQRLGSRVTVVQRSGQILSKEDEDMAAIVLQGLRHEGVDVLLGHSVQRVDRHEAGGVRVSATDADGNERHIHGQELLVAMGRAPNVDGMALDKAGVEYTKKGVPADAKMRTNQKHIYVAGDVTGHYQFTHAAGYEGSIVVSNAIFHVPRKADYTWLPWCTYTEPELASVGMNEKRAKTDGLDYTVWSEEMEDNDRAQAEGETQGRLKLLVDSGGKPLGVQIAGPHAGELINEWVAVLGGKVKLTQLASAVHPYPTLGEINKRVAGKMLSDKLFSETVQKGLKLVFGFKGRACTLPEEK